MGCLQQENVIFLPLFPTSFSSATFFLTKAEYLSCKFFGRLLFHATGQNQVLVPEAKKALECLGIFSLPHGR